MLGHEIVVVSAGAEIDLVDAFETLSQRHTDALIITGDPFFHRVRAFLAALQVRHRIPAIGSEREFAEAGSLMSYGANLAEAYRQGGIYCGRILKGESPSELPVMQPSKFELLINLKTAKTLGRNLPPTLLATADEAIE
jgi:putative ABC transport system substrate-binding protein